MDKTKLEEKITRTVEEIFSYPEAYRKAEELTEELKTLRTKLADAVWRWAKLTFGEGRIANAGKEIMECVDRTLEGFQGESESYINYISAAVSDEIRRAYERNRVFEERQIPLPEKKMRLLRNMLRYAELTGRGHLFDTADGRAKLAGCYDMTGKELERLLIWNARSTTVSENSENGDGEDFLLFDRGNFVQQYSHENAEATLFQKEALEEQIVAIDAMYSGEQERTKPYLSALLTRQVLEELEKGGVESATALKLLEKCSFAMMDKARKVKETFLSGDKCPTQQEVAAWSGRDKTDASRTMRKFLAKMKVFLQESVN